MSRVYVMSEHTDAIKTKLEAKEIPGLELRHKPIDQDGRDSYWPYGVTDGKSYGWFEGRQILFWGTNDETAILKALDQYGYRAVGRY